MYLELKTALRNPVTSSFIHRVHDRGAKAIIEMHVLALGRKPLRSINISGDRAPIPSPVNDLSSKTWRFVTRFTSQSWYFHSEHHWPIVLTWKKQVFNPPPP